MGRFPCELPADLPDAQITLMLSWMAIRAEERSGDRAGLEVSAGRAAERALQAAEAQAWGVSSPRR